MKLHFLLAVASSAILFGACETQASHDSDAKSGHEADGEEAEEIEIALSEIPPAVSAAATRAFPGLKVTKAAKETEHGRLVYCLEGVVDGVEYEIDLSEDGRILEAEQAGEDDDD